MSQLILLDTNILILASQGKFDIVSLYTAYDEVLVSIVTQVEALGFNFTIPAEEQAMRLFLQDLLIAPFTQAEAQHAIAYRKLRKIKFPDAAILATARAAGADLLTQNIADFRGLDAAVRVFAIQEL